MRFLFIAPRLHSNFQYQIQALKDAGHELAFFSLYQFSSEDYQLVRPLVLGYSAVFKALSFFVNKEHKLTKSRFELTYGFPPIFRFMYEFVRFKPDVVFIKNLAHAYSLLGLVIGRLFGKKIIVFMAVEKYRPKERSWSAYIAGKLFGAKVITPLEGDPKYKNDNTNLFFVPLPHPTRELERSYFRDNKINIVCVGKFSKRKDQLLLLEAVNALKHTYPMCVTLIGQQDEGEYLGRIKEYISANDLGSIVELKSDMPWQAVYEEYNKNDIFVLPSYNEQFSFSLIEAMSCGLPVVCSDDNGIKWYVRDGETGFIFKSRDAGSLIEKLRYLMQDKDTIRAIGHAAQRYTKETCSLERYNETIVGLVQNNARHSDQ